MTNPFAAINANGDATTRGVTLAMPLDDVRNLLPSGLEPGPQCVTPPGTHPVILYFHDFLRGGFSFPNPFPRMGYREYSLGVPHVYLTQDSITPGHPGPWYFVPRLFLDNPFPVITGLLGWGFAKRLASIEVTADHYTVSDFSGRKLTSLAWDPSVVGDFKPVGQWPNFVPIRAMLDQPVISQVPLGFGPFFIGSNFDRDWDVAMLKPMQTAVNVDIELLIGCPCGRYPASGWGPGIDQSVLGSWELQAPWRLSMPYPPLFSFHQ